MSVYFDIDQNLPYLMGSTSPVRRTAPPDALAMVEALRQVTTVTYPMKRDAIATHNERTKLFASFLNAIAIGLIGFAVLRPLTEDPVSVSALSAWWGIAGLAVHASSHYILRYLMKGD